jgi:NADH-quinone oxidoreductase subunit M
VNTTRHLLSVLVWLPAVAALFALFLPRQAPKLLRAYGTGTSLFILGQALQLLVGATHSVESRTFRFVENTEWIPSLGIRLPPRRSTGSASGWCCSPPSSRRSCCSCSFGAITTRVKEFIAAMLVLESAMIGAFVALDLFLFYVFWELMLVPMYLIIGMWGGHGDRIYAAVKFFLYTMAGSLLMLARDPLHGRHPRTRLTGHYTFDYTDLMRVRFPVAASSSGSSRLRPGLRDQGPDVPGAHLAARRAHRGAHGRLDDPRRR